jgi:hypothetical protein
MNVGCKSNSLTSNINSYNERSYSYTSAEQELGENSFVKKNNKNENTESNLSCGGKDIYSKISEKNKSSYCEDSRGQSVNFDGDSINISAVPLQGPS